MNGNAINDDDPRVYFAAERTLLAWVRTGLTVIGLGFVVARFGLFLKMLRNAPDGETHLGSTVIGVSLVLLGSIAIGIAARQHARFCRTLSPSVLALTSPPGWSLWFATMLSAVGAILAVYLLMRSAG